MNGRVLQTLSALVRPARALLACALIAGQLRLIVHHHTVSVTGAEMGIASRLDADRVDAANCPTCVLAARSADALVGSAAVVTAPCLESVVPVLPQSSAISASIARGCARAPPVA